MIMPSPPLGKGFSALMGERSAPASNTAATTQTGRYAELAISELEADPDQPRRVFRDADIQNLAESLARHGLLEPIVVQQLGPGKFRLIAGERRLRAARTLGWERLPAVIRSGHPQSNLILALVENLQREDLPPLDEAEAFARLRDQYGLTQGRIAELVGKRRATIANSLRLLGLSPEARRALRDGAIEKGHGRALLAIDDPAAQAAAVTRCVKEGWSVRYTESYAKKQKAPTKTRLTAAARKKIGEDRDYPALSTAIGLQVHLRGRKIILEANNRAEARLFLDRLTRMVRGTNAADAAKGSS
jgi:ParB family chromosome partitioning protein